MNPEVTRIVRNRSSRDGEHPTLIVLHTTEGANRRGLGDLEGLGAWFDNPAAQASSHVGNDNEGNDARFVWDGEKAWTQAYFNPWCLSIEQTGFAATSRDEWFRGAPRQLANTAKWIAYWSARYDIPIRRARVFGTTILRSGVATHKQLGVAGGGHHDPGSAYPVKYVLWLARYFKEIDAGHSGWRFRRARKKVNDIRKYWGLAPLK